jgi:hypothetical protein
MLDITQFIQQFRFDIIAKGALLVLIGLYIVFSLMLMTKVRSFNKIIFLPSTSGATFIQTATLILTVLLISLFLITIVIV